LEAVEGEIVYGSIETDCYSGRASRIWIVIRTLCINSDARPLERGSYD
jgi:hypothetical protein